MAVPVATVLGARGFIGSHLAAELRRRGWGVAVPERNADLMLGELGTVYYCIGLTADFRSRPFDTVEAHVCKLSELLRVGRFERLVYLSSTRVYAGASATDEQTPLLVNPALADDLYNVSKAMGESLALHSGKEVRIARLSNVYGADWNSNNFLSSVIRTGVNGEPVIFRTAPASAKDYVSIHDVVDLLIKIGSSGRQRIYNIASGQNVSNLQLALKLQEVGGFTPQFAPEAPTIEFPAISIARVRGEFGFTPLPVLERLGPLVEEYRKHKDAGK